MTISERWTQRLRDALAVLGVASALLTVLFGARSAYIYFADRRAEAAGVASWIHVAEERASAPVAGFADRLNHLEEAAFALEQAVKLDPSDRELQRLNFMAQATLAYTDLEGRPFAYDDWSESLSELTTEGWRVSTFVTAPAERARLLEALARVEAWRPTGDAWSTTIELLREAVELVPDDAGLRFQLAMHLLERGDTVDEGMQLLHELVDENPNNPTFLVRLGSRLATTDERQRAIELFERAVLLPADDDNWEFEQAQRQARSELYRLVHQLIAGGESATAVVDPRAADPIMDHYFTTTWSGKGLAALYWWQRGSPERALRHFVESDLDFSRASLPTLLDEEFEWFDMTGWDLRPSRAEFEAMQVHEIIAEQFEAIESDVRTYIASIEEAEFFGPGMGTSSTLGAEVQHWPGQGLLLRRVVPGYWLAAAGARPNDWLHSVDGNAPGDIEELRALLAEGSPTSVTVIRGGTSLVLPARGP